MLRKRRCSIEPEMKPLVYGLKCVPGAGNVQIQRSSEGYAGAAQRATRLTSRDFDAGPNQSPETEASCETRLGEQVSDSCMDSML